MHAFSSLWKQPSAEVDLSCKTSSLWHTRWYQVIYFWVKQGFIPCRVLWPFAVRRLKKWCFISEYFQSHWTIIGIWWSDPATFSLGEKVTWKQQNLQLIYSKCELNPVLQGMMLVFKANFPILKKKEKNGNLGKLTGLHLFSYLLFFFF